MKNSLTLLTALLLVQIGICQSSGFVENNGQWHKKVKFTANYGNSNFFLEATGYKVALNKPADVKMLADQFAHHNGSASQEPADKKLILHSHAYEVSFAGAAKDAVIERGTVSTTSNNYLNGTDASKWVANCKIYQSVTYKNIYPGIDVRYYSDNDQFKYDLIVNPGADASQIAMVFDGADGLNTENENLLIKTSVGDMSELKPYTYQQTGSGKTEVAARFAVSGNEVQFKLGNYDKSKQLIIDPVLIFSTFSGSTADNWGFASTYDAQGNMYMAGITFATGFPVSNGAYQTNFKGGSVEGNLSGYDIAILKLNSAGTSRLYATYLGGTGNEEPHNLRVDNNGNLVITGITNSTDFPVTTASFGPRGNMDLFVAKLNSTGTTLLTSKVIGGSDDDGVNIRRRELNPGPTSIVRNYGDDGRSELVIDKDNNICLATCSRSTNFPVTSGALKMVLDGEQDATVIKLSSDLTTVLFSTYLGGIGDDAAFSLAINPLNNHIYVAGSTTSAGLPTTGDDTGPILYKTFRGGVCDGFIAEISSDGTSLINMRYVGTNGNDMLYELATDNNGYPYIMGTTTVAFPVINAKFNSQSSGKQFIAKLSTDLSTVIYSTNFGKGAATPDIAPTAFGLDDCGNVYVTGWGGGINSGEGYPNANTSGLTVTADAIRATTDNSDFYIFVLEKDGASQLYGSFYGNYDAVPDVGDHTDGGNSRFDSKGNLYLTICADCGAVGIFPTTPGSWSTKNLATTGAQCSMAAVKITFNLSGNCALPVTLGSFTAEYSDHRSLLKWNTTQEINSSYFDIEHSMDTHLFSSIGKVNASGNSSLVKNYQYQHNNPSAGLHYYRLKMIDKNGKPTTSEIVSVLVKDNGRSFYLYPNPARSQVTLVYPQAQKSAGILILDNKGAVVLSTTVNAGSTRKDINIQSLPAGWYSIQFGDKTQKQSISFLKE